MLPEDVIIKPVVTEKSNDAVQLSKYTFRVNKKATKVDIKRAVEKLFDVKDTYIQDYIRASGIRC